jgi:hypothetical protein
MRLGEQIAFFAKQNHSSCNLRFEPKFDRDTYNVPSAARLVIDLFRLSDGLHKINIAEYDAMANMLPKPCPTRSLTWMFHIHR